MKESSPSKKAGLQKNNSVSLSDITVLFSADYISSSIEEACKKKEIPYTLFSGVPFFERIKIKDALSYLRMVLYKAVLSFLRVVNVPKRHIGKQRIVFLFVYDSEQTICLYEYFTILALNELFYTTTTHNYI